MGVVCNWLRYARVVGEENNMELNTQLAALLSANTFRAAFVECLLAVLLLWRVDGIRNRGIESSVAWRM